MAGTAREGSGVTASSEDPKPSVGELVRQASEHVSTLVRGEVELARTELSDTVKRAGLGGGLLAGAVVVVLLSLPFLFVVLAELLVEVGLARWLAYLIVWGFFVIVALVLALLGRRSLKKVRKPERTMETVRDTAEWARHPTRETG
jgi:uncharacterized membrane protein YqjE